MLPYCRFTPKAVIAEAGRRSVLPLQASNFEAMAGRGARAMADGKSTMVGVPRLLPEAQVRAPAEVEKSTSAWASEGKTVLIFPPARHLLSLLCVKLALRPT